MGDYHVHLHDHGPYRGAGPEPGTFPQSHIERYVETAAKRGVDVVCFTEHLYRCVESAPILGEFWEGPNRDLAERSREFLEIDRTLSIDAYVDAVAKARDKGLPVLLGFEVDYFPGSVEAVLEFLRPYPWDVLIGAPHWIGEWLYDDHVNVEEFERRGVRQAYEDFFALEAELAGAGLVDVLAHADAIKVRGHNLEEPPIDLYAPVVAAAAASGVAVEVNTHGLDKQAGEIYPSPTFLGMFHDAGVPMTLASDAHVPEDTAKYFDEARALAGSVGYTERLEFRQRVAHSVPL